MLQAISDYRARLSKSYNPTNKLANDDQGILLLDNVTANLVPSNGYTFDRTLAQARDVPCFCGSVRAASLAR